ncbi:undecaprenyl/decaprenyl-phosphate alpha-N-acetylglucosaminyl 1-phosphate transferase [Actinocrinis puniceicyclus]|uniref:Undecaprenyl/decaprenyl-phosphate alpha-N-acetylglucosaminyl 1-phosphate transferase n=1 Tax=Actinocrinis puniceicyclus TaxID=977794 RepID=A0A8J8BE62_9ACTN|nr:MraY family glycosyltransferase [Actinocrinis puniceicyclus]MBS2964881.1 undecaprenyl/decaprenyl-phosphate alpha-N-acetylglucosaminyl 1-phosphate transferase [Actinocrinis puniceicyclus]
MREYLVVMAVAWVVTYLTTGLVRVAAIRFGAAPEVRERDVHSVPTPRLGGVAMYLGFMAALAFAARMPMLHERVYTQSLAIPGLLWGSGLLIALGVVDDRWGVDALVKLAGQIFAASVMVLSGVQINWLPIPGYGTVGLDPTTAAVLSILVVVVMINAVNFVDGLDGLAAGMCAIAALAFFAYAYRLQVGYFITAAAPAVMIAAIVAGMCFGFLCHNWSPARIFMGDSGSMLLGLLLAATTILAIGQVDPDQVVQAAHSQTAATHKSLAVYIPLVLPFSCLALPMIDMVMAVVRRTAAGRSPFSADKQHLHHRLLEIGHSRQRAVVIMYLWAALISAAVILVTVTPQHRPPILVAMGALVLGLLVLLLPQARRRMDARADRRDARHAARTGRRVAPAAAVLQHGSGPRPGKLPDLVHSAADTRRPPG